MRDRRDPPEDMAWVRIDCVRYRDRRPYHWTRECVEGRALIEISRAESEGGDAESVAVQAVRVS